MSLPSSPADDTIDIAPHDRPQKSPPLPDEPEPWGWTRRQRIGLAVLLILALALLSLQYLRHPYPFDEPLVMHQGQALEFETRLDPNTADVLSLARLPRLSEKAAQAIVDFREARRSAEHPIVFQTIDDLGQVPLSSRTRITKETLKAIRPYVVLPGDTPDLVHPGLKPYARVPETQADTAPNEDR